MDIETTQWLVGNCEALIWKAAAFLLQHVLFQLPPTLACFHWTLKFKLSGFLYCSGLTFEYHVKHEKWKLIIHIPLVYAFFLFFRESKCECWMGNTNKIDSSKWQNNDHGKQKDWAFYFLRKWSSQSSNNDFYSEHVTFFKQMENPLSNSFLYLHPSANMPTSSSHVSTVWQLR